MSPHEICPRSDPRAWIFRQIGDERFLIGQLRSGSDQRISGDPSYEWRFIANRLSDEIGHGADSSNIARRQCRNAPS
jgi:hypothetical protein